MMSKKDKDEVTGVDTTGHEWDGIKELNNPLPRWWLWTLLRGATPGLLGYSTRGEVAERIAEVKAQNAEVSALLAQSDLASMDKNGPVYRFGISGGGAVYRANCSQCHGAGAAGAKGYPNLLDDDWLWGGSLPDIEATIRHGIRNTQDDDARYSEMPSEIAATARYVLSLSGANDGATPQGQTLFSENCSACHGAQGQGDREQGAPALNDAIRLYGGNLDAVTASITNARFGVMPAWGARLSEADIKAVSLYIHQLGGGE